MGIGKVGIGVSASTLGVGPQVAVSKASTLNLRAGANFLIFGRNFTHDGIHYNATLDFRNGDVLLDWFPFHGGFHVSGGALIYKYAQFWPIVAKTFGYRF